MVDSFIIIIEIANQVQSNLPKEFNHYFDSLTTLFPFYYDAKLDLGLANSPRVSSKNVLTKAKGTVSITGMQCPLVERNVMKSGFGSKMVEVLIGENEINCVLWALFQKGWFNRSFGLDQPILGLPIVLNVSLQHAPALLLTNNGYFRLNLTRSQLSFSLPVADGMKDYRLDLQLNLALQFELRLIEQSLVPNIVSVSMNVEQISKQTDTHSFQIMEHLSYYVSRMFHSYYSSFVEEYYSNLVPVPVVLPYPFDSISFRDIDMEVRDGVFWTGLELYLQS